MFGENFVLRSGEVLGGNLAVLGGTATLQEGSTVRGDVAVAGGQLFIAGTVEGSAAVLGGTAELAETAVIKGDFASFGGTANVASGATIEGESFGGLRSDGPAVEIPELPRLPATAVIRAVVNHQERGFVAQRRKGAFSAFQGFHCSARLRER